MSNEAQQRPRTKKRSTDPLIGTTLAGKYKIGDKLGEGGMGTVYRATQMPIDRLVAVKVLLGKLAEDEVAVKRFEQEARAVSKMQHPNTVTIYDYGQTVDGRLYLVMEFLKGRTLTDLLRREAPIAQKRAIHVMQHICSSLADAHAAGIIHRDLKPDNIFLTEVGADKDFAKVLDFGVAKLADSDGGSLTQTGMIFGTPKYMSPEQAEGKPIDCRADIYALGVVLYEMLTGRPPFLGDTAVALLLKHISEPPPVFAKIRPDLNVHEVLEQITMKALAKDPEERYLSVTALSHDLSGILTGISSGSTAVVPRRMQPEIRGEGLPTEVVPGPAGSADLSPGDLRAPQALPSSLSLSVPGAWPDGTAIPARAPTAPAATPRPLVEAGLAITPAGATQPIVGQGPAIETLGGVLGLDPSERLRPPRKKANPMLWVGGAALLLAAGILVATTISPRGSPSGVESLEPPAPTAAIRIPPEGATPPDSAKDSVEARPGNSAPEPSTAAVAIPVSNSRASADRAPSRRRDPVSAKNPEASEAARKVTFRFESEPAGAVVLLESKQLGRTPFTTEFGKSIDLVTFVFTQDGFERSEVLASLNADRVVQARLTAKAESSAPVPKPVERDKKLNDARRPEELLKERVDELKEDF